MTAVYERELRSYLNSMTGYVFAAFLLLFAGIYTMALNLRYGYSNFEYVLQNMSFIFLIAIPILSMRIISEDRRQKTDQLLYSLPLGMTRVVVGKFLAMVTVIAIPVAVLCTYPLLLSCFGTISYAAAYGAIFGFFLFASALAAIGMLVSSFTENQSVAAGICFGVMLLLYFMYDLSSYVSTTATASLAALMVLVLILAFLVRYLTKNTLASLGTAGAGIIILIISFFAAKSSFEGLFGKIMKGLSLFERYSSFGDGVFDLTALLYFLTVIAVCLFLTVQAMEKRRWN